MSQTKNDKPNPYHSEVYDAWQRKQKGLREKRGYQEQSIQDLVMIDLYEFIQDIDKRLSVLDEKVDNYENIYVVYFSGHYRESLAIVEAMTADHAKEKFMAYIERHHSDYFGHGRRVFMERVEIKPLDMSQVNILIDP